MSTVVSSPPYRTPGSHDGNAPAHPEETARLGKLRSTHRPAQVSRQVLLALPLGVVVMVLAKLPALRHPDELGVLALSVLVTFAIVAVVVVRINSSRKGCQVDVYEGGLVAQRRDKHDIIVFDNVDELWFEQTGTWPHPVNRIRALRFVDRDGTQHRASIEVEDSLEVLRWTLRQCSDPLLPEARAVIAAGETVTFGKIRLDRDGITIGNARCWWRDIRFVRSHLGALSLFRRRPILAWRTVALDTIPHPTVFGRLVAEHVPRVEHDFPLGMSSE